MSNDWDQHPAFNKMRSNFSKIDENIYLHGLLFTDLYANHVISQKEKEKIDSAGTHSEKLGILFNTITRPSEERGDPNEVVLKFKDALINNGQEYVARDI